MFIRVGLYKEGCRKKELGHPDPACPVCKKGIPHQSRSEKREQEGRGVAGRKGALGEAPEGEFQHLPPENAPRHDLRTLRHLPDDDLSRDVDADPDLRVT